MLGQGLKRALIGLLVAFWSSHLARELWPFIRPRTSILYFIANLQISGVFFAAVLLLSESVNGFGLKDSELGILLLLMNIVCFVLVVYWGFQLEAAEEARLRKRENNVVKIEWACGFTKTKFATTLSALVAESLSISDVLCFHYTSMSWAKEFVRAGLPAFAAEQGVVFSLNALHDLTDEDRAFFTDIEVVLVCVLPKRLLVPFHVSRGASSLWLMPSKLLSCVRVSDFSEILSPELWVHGCLVLPPYVIKRAYLVSSSRSAEIPLDIGSFDRDYNYASSPMKESDAGLKARSLDKMRSITDEQKNDFSLNRPRWLSTQLPSLSFSMDLYIAAQNENVQVIKAQNCQSYLAAINTARNACAERGLLPIFHYTQPSLAPLILSAGLRMSTQGQGDGGVYFSTLSPASYELGSQHYEHNISKINLCCGDYTSNFWPILT